MPNTLQDHLAAATQKASDELTAAFLHLPEGKRAWSPADTARTPLDLLAECAILNGYTADLIQTRQWQMESFDKYFQEKAALVTQGWEHIQPLLHENTRRVIEAIRAVPDDALGTEIPMPWGTQTLAHSLDYPYWNMSYHQGQVNYLASILGCLP